MYRIFGRVLDSSRRYAHRSPQVFARSRRDHRRAQLVFESLEDRCMLAHVASLERIHGLVYAESQAVTIVDFNLESDSDVYSNDPPDETFIDAYAEMEEVQDNASGSSRAGAAAYHSPPVGDTTKLAQAVVATAYNGDVEGIGGGAVAESYGSGGSNGKYEIPEGLPNNPVFHARILLKSIGTGYETEDGVVDVAPNQVVQIETIGGTNGDIWWVAVDSIRPQNWEVDTGAYHAKWMVTYHLPDRPDDSFLVSGQIDLHFDVVWDYDDSETVEVLAAADTSSGPAVAAAGSEDSAGFAWTTISQVSLYIQDGNTVDDFVPGGMLNPIPELMPPKVENVTISSTVSNSYGTNPPYSFSGIVGSEEQIRTVPVGGANRIAIQFSKDVDISSGDLDLIALNRVVTEPSVSGFVAPDSSNNYTATWTFASALPGAQYLLRLPDSVEGFDGNALDGEWTNPGSLNSDVTTTIFPSGDNVAGGDFEFVFTYLPGDANRDNEVNGSDFGILGGHYGIESNMAWENADFTGEGAVNDSDFAIFAGYYGLNHWKDLAILADYDGDFDLDGGDETAFLAYYNSQNSAADLNGDSNINSADYDAFYDLFGFGVDLRVLT